MPVVAQETARSPFYYIKKRFLNNKPAVFGLAIIVFCVLLTLLGNLVMPDRTPDANDGAAQIQKKPLGFQVDMLKMRRGVTIEDNNIFTDIYSGIESQYRIIPIESHRIEGIDVFVREYNGSGEEKKYSIVKAVLPLYIGQSGKMAGSQNYELQGETIRYVDADENIQTITRSELISRFQKENIETRNYMLGTDKVGRDMLSRLIMVCVFRCRLGLYRCSFRYW
jgi:ABC-type dipeptide/oligopeptide/nickel transport system permease subunit